MAAKAQGDETDGRGYNLPSLLSAMVGAPYLHADRSAPSRHPRVAVRDAPGGARPGFLAQQSPEEIAKLVHFLLAIDEDAEPIAIPPVGPQGGDFCRTP